MFLSIIHPRRGPPESLAVETSPQDLERRDDLVDARPDSDPCSAVSDAADCEPPACVEDLVPPEAGAPRVLLRQFILWAQTAPEDHRVEAVGALARALLHGHLSPEDRNEAELALLAMLDDPAPCVRAAIAQALARSADAPRAALAGLLQDQSDIAAAVLEHSPVLGDAELVDQTALSDAAGQRAIARRARISPAVAGALAEVGARDAVLDLLANPGARIADGSLKRIVERFGHDSAVRDVLLRRPDLAVEIRLSLAAALSRSLSALAGRGGPEAERLEQKTREACERTIVAMAAGADAALARRIVVHLRASGLLTPGLILRAALSGGLSLVEAAFAELTGLAVPRVAAVLKQTGVARAALYGKAGLPSSLQPALLAVFAALYEGEMAERPPGLSRRLVERALAAAEGQGNPMVTAVLERYAAEALREEARLLARSVVEEAHLFDLGPQDLVGAALPLPAPDAPDPEDVVCEDPEDVAYEDLVATMPAAERAA
jgi:uncharacterized protein (DUF2336 family)